MGCSVGHTWVSYPSLSLIGSPGPLTPLELQESSRQALLWGPPAPPYTLPRLHQGPDSSPLGWTSVGPSGNVGAARRFWFLQSLGVSFAGKWTGCLVIVAPGPLPVGLAERGSVVRLAIAALRRVEGMWARTASHQLCLSHSTQDTAVPSAGRI